ncbi:MAG: pyridoxamine 5'-phosphate oxidase family protein [Phycisphaerae bacterium]|nr:pyridoxamine 5'-phosphate oxidase family protein [Phycisphaerae bacterium]
MKIDPLIEDKLKMLFSSQKFAVLATQQKKDPYTSLIAFSCSKDMRQIVFATPKATRKYANILAHSNVSIFIDNRSNKAVDLRRAMGVTVLGSARQMRKNKNSKLMKLHLDKHPQLESFLSSPSCAFICIDIQSFYIVERFQNVTEIHLE